MPTHDRVLGCLLAGAVADALGYEVEFSTLRTILAERGPSGVRGPRHEHGEIEASDDTQMTLFTAEGLARAARAGWSTERAVAEVRLAYLDWLETQRQDGRGHSGPLARREAMRKRQAPGKTCLSALSAGGTGTPEEPINGSKGCGGVMRVAPVGLIPGLSAAEAFDLGARTAAITHGHATGMASAGAMAVLVRAVAGGASVQAAAEASAAQAAASGAGPLAATIRRAVAAAGAGRLERREMTDRLGEGWVGDEALAVGICAALCGTDFVDAVSIAATHSGDSDSTASIAAQILGARDGAACVPGDWRERLDLLGAVEDTAAEFCRAFSVEVPPAAGAAEPDPPAGFLAKLRRILG